jgi:hypothetical protein
MLAVWKPWALWKPIMGFVETKEAQGKQLPADHIPGYTYISKPRVVRAGERASGGVAAAVHASVANAVKVYDFADQQYDEALWLVLPGQGGCTQAVHWGGLHA